MRLRTSLTAPAINASWFSPFIEALEQTARNLDFGADGQMNPPTSLSLTSGTHATSGARYELANTLPSGVTAKDDLVVDDWSSSVIALTNTDSDDISKVKFTRDVIYGLKQFDVEMADRNSSGLSLRGHANVQNALTRDGEFSEWKVKHKIAKGKIFLTRTAVDDSWRIDVEIRVCGRGPLRPILAAVLVFVRPLISRWLRRSVKQIAREGIPQLRAYLKQPPEDVANEAVRAWLASS